MKKWSLVILSFIALISQRCGVVNSSPSSSIHNTKIISGNIARELISANKQDSTTLTISYQYFDIPISNSLNRTAEIYKDSVNLRICEFVKSITEFEGRDTYCDLSESFISAQLDSFIAIYRVDEDEYSTVWRLESEISLDDSKNSFIPLTFYVWSYTGGAHGNGFKSIHMFDKKEGALLSVYDFVSDVAELNRIAEPIFRKDMELSDSDDLENAGFWFDNNLFSVNDNFYFIDDKMVFSYNTYEIAPYSAGPIELVIPLTKIKHLLKRDI